MLGRHLWLQEKSSEGASQVPVNATEPPFNLIIDGDQISKKSFGVQICEVRTSHNAYQCYHIVMSWMAHKLIQQNFAEHV